MIVHVVRSSYQILGPYVSGASTLFEAFQGSHSLELPCGCSMRMLPICSIVMHCLGSKFPLFGAQVLQRAMTTQSSPCPQIPGHSKRMYIKGHRINSVQFAQHVDESFNVCCECYGVLRRVVWHRFYGSTTIPNICTQFNRLLGRKARSYDHQELRIPLKRS